MVTHKVEQQGVSQKKIGFNQFKIISLYLKNLKWG